MTDEQNINRRIRPCTVIWLLLVALTGLTYGIGEMGVGGLSAMAFVLITALVKADMVARYFMGLRNVRFLWRAIVFGYLILVCTMIGLAYTLGMGS